MTRVLQACSVLDPAFKIIPYDDDQDVEFKEFIRTHTDVMISLYKDCGEHFKVGPEHPMLTTNLIALIARRRPKRILEVGYECGGSTVAIAWWCYRNNASYMSLEDHSGLFSGDVQTERLRNFLVERFGVEGLVVIDPDSESYPYSKPPHSYYKKIQVEEPFDFVFFDHTKVASAEEAHEMLKLGMITPDAWCVIHDVDTEMERSWVPNTKYALDNNLGKCSLLSDGFMGIVAHELGVIQLGESLTT